MIITITLLVLITLAVILYRSMSSNTFSDVADEKNTSLIVKSFMDKMIPHHQEAVDISLKVMNDLDITEAKVRIFAANVVDTQTFEISKMKNIYADYLGQSYDEAIPVEYDHMMHTVSDKKGDESAKEYTADMIKHHESAVEMSKDYIKLIDKINKSNSTSENGLVIMNTHPAIEDSYALAKQIIEGQTKEIAELKTWFK